ncbi:NUDIX hydrolase [Anaerotignum sp.]
MKEFLDIVDETGQPTGEIVDRETAHAKGVLHRTSHVWLARKKNGKIQILLQKRAKHKSSFPGCYDISSAGHIPAGDRYEISALRELKEELGVKAEEKDLIYCGDRKVIWDDVFFGKPFHDRQISRVFLLWLDREESEFTIQEEEVDSVLWMDFEQCYAGVQNGLFQNCIVLEELEVLKKALA